MGDFVYQVKTTESRELAFFAILYRHHRDGHTDWPSRFNKNFGQPMGHPEEATIEFHSWSRKLYKTTVPKGPRYGGKKTQKVKGIALKVQHGLALSRGQMRVLHWLCPSLHCNAAQLVREEETTLPVFNRDITNTRLLVDVCFSSAPVGIQKNATVLTAINPFVSVHFCRWCFPTKCKFASGCR